MKRASEQGFELFEGETLDIVEALASGPELPCIWGAPVDGGCENSLEGRLEGPEFCVSLRASLPGRPLDIPRFFSYIHGGNRG